MEKDERISGGLSGEGGKEDFGRSSKMSSFVLQIGSHLASAKAPVSLAKAFLDCILTRWDLFNPWALRKEHLRFFCTQAWPGYKLSMKKMASRGKY